MLDKIDKKRLVENALLLLVILVGTGMALWVDSYVESLPQSPRVVIARPG